MEEFVCICLFQPHPKHVQSHRTVPMELLKRDGQRHVCRTKRKSVCLCVCGSMFVLTWKYRFCHIICETNCNVSSRTAQTRYTRFTNMHTAAKGSSFTSANVLRLQFPLGMTSHTLKWEGVWRELGCLARSASFAVREESGHSLKSALSVQSEASCYY